MHLKPTGTDEEDIKPVSAWHKVFFYIYQLQLGVIYTIKGSTVSKEMRKSQALHSKVMTLLNTGRATITSM